MRSTKNTRAIVIGIFVFVALAIFVLCVLTLGGQKKSFVKAITINALFDDVNGLQKGNNVWFSGVKVGTVKSINFTRNAHVQVAINIEEQVVRFIRKDAMAKISTDGLIGNKIIVVYGGTATQPQVVAGDVLIVEKAASTEEMLNTLQSNNKNLLAITGDVKTLTANLASGQGTLGRLLTDQSLLNSMQSAVATLNRASVNAEKLSASLSSYASRLQTKGTLANDLVTDTTVFSSVRTTLSQLQVVSDAATAVMKDLKHTTENLSDSNNTVGVLLRDPQSAEGIKATIQNLQSGTKKLDENMEALQHNFLLRGFFKKKKAQQ